MVTAPISEGDTPEVSKSVWIAVWIPSLGLGVVRTLVHARTPRLFVSVLERSRSTPSVFVL